MDDPGCLALSGFFPEIADGAGVVKPSGRFKIKDVSGSGAGCAAGVCILDGRCCTASPQQSVFLCRFKISVQSSFGVSWVTALSSCSLSVGL